jgi:hypothetical protein
VRLDHLLSREFPVIGNSRSVGRYVPITSSGSHDRTAAMLPVEVILVEPDPSFHYLLGKRHNEEAQPECWASSLSGHLGSILREVSEHGHDFTLDFYVVRGREYGFHLAVGRL